MMTIEVLIWIIIKANYEPIIQYKKTYGMEGYLNFISNPILGKAFSELRISDSKLPIEIGRYNGTKLPDRIWTNCNLNKIGDEEHFLVNCNNAQIVSNRNIMLNNISNVSPQFPFLDNHSKFQYLFAGKDQSVLPATSNFINESFKILA